MKLIQRFGKSLVAGGLFGVIVMGAMALSSDVAEAKLPPLLCGPTYQWSCTGVGGPSTLFIGTVCDANAFALANRLICVPL